jgi:alkyldihydroxyacetonephosphate synthase
LEIFEHLASVVKDAVKKSGGSLSHHHGIGKKNAYKYGKIMSNVSKEMLMSLKERIDPKNVFAAGNLIYNDREKLLKAKM